ncbi:MAG: phosphatase PAP2 family protein [Oscillospiraceae bacterium]|nr:phosphatase PAP2 family protein [Oscillospiraceae bacterium]
MSFLYLLEKLRVPGLNELMLAVTTLGEETAFLVIALIVFWCVDKRKGYYIMSVGFLGTMANQFLKLLCRVPRPWVLDPEFSILEQAREAATGYSFPSGHSQTAVGTFGCVAATTRKRWLKVISIVIMVLVPFSRMYVGVHTPSDVLVGSGMALALVWLLKPLAFHEDNRRLKALIAGMIALAVAFLLFVELYPFPADMDAHNLESGCKNAYTLLGCLIGVAIVYAADKKWLNFQAEAVWWAQILKCVIGLALVLLVKSGLKAPLEALFGGHMAARAVRYFLIVLVAGAVWPMSFRWFGKLGKKE